MATRNGGKFARAGETEGNGEAAKPKKSRKKSHPPVIVDVNAFLQMALDVSKAGQGMSALVKRVKAELVEDKTLHQYVDSQWCSNKLSYIKRKLKDTPEAAKIPKFNETRERHNWTGIKDTLSAA